jgi:glycosyl transferase family 2
MTHLQKLDNREIPSVPGEIRCFVGIKNERMRLAYFLRYYRQLGVDRFFFIDNGSSDNSVAFLAEQDDCHCFHSEGSHFADNIWPPRWLNTLLNVFGRGHWCVCVDADELLVYPHCETLQLQQFCAYLDHSQREAVAGLMLDMYGSGPVANAKYREGQPFLKTSRYFDHELGWINPVPDSCPPEQMFGGVRERAFWIGKYKQTLPPCISKVPVVRWQRGVEYKVAQHFISNVRLSELCVALLHFKFLIGFQNGTTNSLLENRGVAEKTLEERGAYLEALKRKPRLRLRNEKSIEYKDSRQLVELGWAKTSQTYERFARSVKSHKWCSENSKPRRMANTIENTLTR